MESILTQYPYIDEAKPPTPDRPASPAQPINGVSTKYGGPGPSLPSSTSDDGWVPLPQSPILPTLPYSPTKTELESHPIRQRLSSQGDEVSSGSGAAPEISFETFSWTRPAEQELAQEVERSDFATMADTSIKEGDAVSYGWGGDKKGGTVTEVKTSGSVEMETARGNTATKEGSSDDPAIRLERAGHDVVKNASEVQKEETGETHNEGGVQKKVAEEGGVENGKKRAAEPKENGEEPKKKKGRPAKNGTGGVKKETKKRAPKRAATESGEPRRSGRNANK